MPLDLDQERAQLLSSGFFARISSSDFKAGRLSRSLAGAGVSALSDALRGVVLDIPESCVLVELARDDIRELLGRPPRGTFGREYRRATELEALETCEWLLSGRTHPSLLNEALRLREEDAKASELAGGVSVEQVDEFLPIAYLAGAPERARVFYERSKRPVRGATTPRGVVMALCESGDSAAPLVDKLLRRKVAVWFLYDGFSHAVPWLRIRSTLLRTTGDSPWSVIRSAREFLAPSEPSS